MMIPVVVGFLSATPVTAQQQDVNRTTIVDWDITGTLQKLDELPEAAALDVIDIPDEERNAARAVLDRRRAETQRSVRTHMRSAVDLLEAARTADESDDETDAAALREEADAFRERLRHGSHTTQLVDMIGQEVSADAARALRAEVRAYWRAVVKDARLIPAPNETYMDARDEAIAREQDRLLVVEIASVIDEYAATLSKAGTELFDTLELNNDQRATIDAIFAEAPEPDLTVARRDQQRDQYVRTFTALEDRQSQQAFIARLTDLMEVASEER